VFGNSHHHYLALVALLLWLLASLSGTHAHFSFDEHEPPLSAHMEIVAEHTAHHADDHHVDIDAEQLQTVLSSKVKLDLLLIALLLLLPLLRIERLLASVPHPPLKPPCRSHTLRPPLRAPPITPA
jgi:hypothetical protein